MRTGNGSFTNVLLSQDVSYEKGHYNAAYSYMEIPLLIQIGKEKKFMNLRHSGHVGS